MKLKITDFTEDKVYYNRERDAAGVVTRTPYTKRIKRKVGLNRIEIHQHLFLN